MPLVKRLFLFLSLVLSQCTYCQQKKDTSLIGIYLKSIYDLNPSEFSFGADFYIWANSTDSLPLFKQIEIINAKVLNEYSSFNDTEQQNFITYENCKAHLTHHWLLGRYPFDRQKFRIDIESQEPQDFVFLSEDKTGFQISENLQVPGWEIMDHYIEKSYVTYPSDFGYKNVVVSDRRFNHLCFTIELKRKSLGLYLKLFLGLYIAFMVSSLAFFVRADYIDPRFGLSIGGLFASVANKYVVDANIPATLGFSFVDVVHFLTFIAILATLVCSAISLRLCSQGNFQKSRTLDKRASIVLISAFVLINVLLIIFVNY